MKQERSTSLEPRLPEDPAYWDGLANRITAGADPLLRELAAAAVRSDSWWSVLAARAPALAAAAAVAIVAGTVAASSGTSPADQSPYDEIARAIGPTDEIAQAFFAEASPPRIESLLPLVAAAGEER